MLQLCSIYKILIRTQYCFTFQRDTSLVRMTDVDTRQYSTGSGPINLSPFYSPYMQTQRYAYKLNIYSLLASVSPVFLSMNVYLYVLYSHDLNKHGDNMIDPE